MPSKTIEVECPDCGLVHEYVVETDANGEVVESYLASDSERED